MERIVFEATLATGKAMLVAACYAPNPEPDGSGNDAAIGYAIADPDTQEVAARGVMPYSSVRKVYDEIEDVQDDLLAYLEGRLEAPVIFAEPVGADPARYLDGA